MLRLVLGKDGGDPKIVLGFSNENLRRLREGEPTTFKMEELVETWVGDVWIAAAGATPKTLVKAAADAAHRLTQRHQIVLHLDDNAFAKLEAFPRRAVSIELKQPWQGRLFLVRGDTEVDLLEEWAPWMGPETQVKIDPRTL